MVYMAGGGMAAAAIQAFSMPCLGGSGRIGSTLSLSCNVCIDQASPSPLRR